MFHRTLFTMNNRGQKLAALLVVLAAVGLGLAAWQLSAQESALPGYRTYPLRNASATDLAAQVRGVLAGVKGKSDVVIDQRSNALLVSGSDEAQRVVAQLVGALDLPAQPMPGKAKGEPVLKAYRLPDAGGEKLVTDLRRRFPASKGTSLSVDARTNQLLALAPADVHLQLAKELAGDGQVEKASAQQPAKLNGLRDAAALAAPPEVMQRAYALKNINWQNFEDFLQRIWGNKAALETNRSGEVAAIRLKNAAGEEAIARVDRRHNEVSFEGSRGAAGNWAKLVSVLDSGPAPREQALQLVPVHRADPDQLQDAIELIKAAMRDGGPRNAGDAARALPVGDRARQPGGELVAKIFQPVVQPPAAQPPAAQPAQPGAEQPGAAQPMGEGEIPAEGAIGPVQIEFLEGLDVIVIRGKKEDVERVTAIIRQIEAQSATTTPVIELYYLRNTSSTAVGDLVIQLYNSVLAARGGRVSITPLGKPNALLMIGSRDSINAVLELVKKLDVPVNPNSLFKVFQLKYMAAADAKVFLDDFFLDRTAALSTVVKVSVDSRTNAVVVYGGERDIAEAERLLTNLDRDDTSAQMEIRTFKLNNALASDLAPLLQQALTGTGSTTGQGQPGGQQGTTTTTGTAAQAKLSMQVLDAVGNKIIVGSGITSGITITADTNSNALLVRSPTKSMDLIAALIEELDRLPESEAQIKVFTIVNGDATALGTMLQQLFGGGSNNNNQDGFNQPITASGENTLVPLSFAVDARTNSVIASGAAGDLNVVEAILLRLDEGDVRQRKTTVYRLKNAPAIDVANAINQFLTNERAVQQLNQAQSPFEQLEREVVVVPEAVSNSLIVSATPRFYDEVAKVVEELDARPPMVMIQVLIAEVSLSDTEEFGAEFGLQDSILFDRSTSVAGVGVPGFNFNNNPLGNSNSAQSLATRNDLGGQSLTSFSVGRTNGPLGYGGLVLSASNDSVSILIRALQDSQRMQVLSRPQVMTLDNQSAFVQVGQRVPRITSTTNSQNGITNATVLENVGLLLGVTPRISPDGLVVMEIDAEKSQLGPVDTGIPISINQNGDVIRSPIINTTLAQTTVSARSGQTVILSGLITKNRNISSRRIPYLSDIPVLGRLFRFDSSTDSRSELLIIMTPHIVRNEADADWLKQVESDRMSWCLADVVEIHGAASGLSGGHGLWGPALPPVIFPDLDPTGMGHHHGDGMEAPLPLQEEGVTPGEPRTVPTPPQPRDPFLNPPLPQPTVPPQVTPPSPAVSPFFPPRTSSAKDKNNGANSSRRAPEPTPAKPIKQAAYSQYPQGSGELGLRTEKSDTATVFYAEPPSSTPRRMPPTNQPVYGPAPRGEAAPAYYQQTPTPMGASKYPTQQAYAPAR